MNSLIDAFAIGLLFASPVLFGLLCASGVYRVLDALGMIEPDGAA